MPSPRRRWWYRMAAFVAALVVVAAALSATFTLTLNTNPRLRHAIEARTADLLGAPTTLGHIALDWSRILPEVALQDVTLHDAAGQPALQIARLRVMPDYLALLHGETRPARVTLVGLRATLDVDAARHITLRGFDTRQTRPEWPLSRMLGGLEHVTLRDCRVTVADVRLGTQEITFRIDGHATRHGPDTRPDYRLAFTVTPPTRIADSLSLSAELHGAIFAGNDWNGNWRTTLHGLRHGPWLDAALGSDRHIAFENGQIQAQGQIVDGRPSSAALRFSAAHISAFLAAQAVATLRAPVVAAHWTRQAHGWRLDVQQLDATGDDGTAFNLAPVTLESTAVGATPGLRLHVAHLPLAPLRPWLAFTAPRAVPSDLLPGLHGALTNVSAELQSATPTQPAHHTLAAQVTALGWKAHGDAPGMEGINGMLRVADDSGDFTPTGGLTLDWPQHFAAPIALEQLGGPVRWQRLDSGAWQINAPAVDAALAGARAQGTVQFTTAAVADATAPRIAVDLHLTAADAARLKPLMPQTWSPHLRAWLAAALVKVPITDGRLVIDGVPHAFPYARPDEQPLGHWALDLQVVGATLHFSPEWPAARQLSAALHFTADRMHIGVGGARLDGVHIQQASADLEHFHADPLTITAAADADMAAWYALLRASPLHEHLRGLVDESTATGPAHVELRLDIPLIDEKDTTVAGTARLDGVSYQPAVLNQPAAGIVGQLAFDHTGLTALALHGSYDGTPVDAVLDAGPGAAPNDPTLRLHFKADPARDAIAVAYLPAWLRPFLAGSSAWQLALPLQHAHDWKLTTDLRGTAIDLPPPLEKPADAARPLTVTPTTDAAGNHRLHIDAGAPLGLNLRYGPPPAGLAGIGLRIGPGPSVAADDDGLRIAGHFDRLDLDALQTVLSAAMHAPADTSGDTPTAGAEPAPSSPWPSLLDADLTAGTLVWRAVRINHVHARIVPDGPALKITVDGRNADGTLTWTPALAGRPQLQARLKKLAITAFPHQVSTAAAPITLRPPFDPATLPTLDLRCEALSVGTQDFGTLKLVTRPSPNGQALQTATLSGPDAGVSASGDWTRVDGRSSARLGFAIDVRHLGSFLQVFGYGPTVTAAKAKLSGSVRFPPAPTGLDLAQPTGTVDVRLEDGTLSSVRPGMGRVFGLLNVYALPRRLLHGFKNVASSGLAYDRLTAHFTLGGGQARTQDAHIDGPSLSLDVRGRIGLRDHDLDQNVRVYTNVASGITLGAVLLGGPIAGGVALLAQQLVGKALNNLTELNYRVTGPWGDPQVVRLDDDPQPAPAARAAAANPAPPAGADRLHPPQQVPSSTPNTPE